LAGPISSQGFKPFARKACEISEGGGCLEYLQSFPALPIEALEWSDELSVCEKLRALVPEAQDHRREV
jgi:hypothetical protein